MVKNRHKAGRGSTPGRRKPSGEEESFSGPLDDGGSESDGPENVGSTQPNLDLDSLRKVCNYISWHAIAHGIHWMHSVDRQVKAGSQEVLLVLVNGCWDVVECLQTQPVEHPDSILPFRASRQRLAAMSAAVCQRRLLVANMDTSTFLSRQSRAPLPFLRLHSVRKPPQPY